MNEDAVVEFLRDIANQLGPAGEEAFRVVAARVFAESVVWVGFGVIFLVFGLITSAVFYRWWDKNNPNDATWLLALIILILSVVVAAMTIVPNTMNLLGLEYATIERILDLVGRAT